MRKSGKIFVRPNKGEVMFFEGSGARVPQEGAEVESSVYYQRLIIDGSFQTEKIKKQKTQEELK